MIHLIVQPRGAPEFTYDSAPREASSDLRKDPQEFAFEVPLKGAL